MKCRSCPQGPELETINLCSARTVDEDEACGSLGGKVKRVHESLTGRIERPLLQWLCSRMPAWLTSDQLTALGVVGSGIAFIGYWLSQHSSAYLWLACLGILLNWFGDSLDGSLARYRARERPRYGFFLDHMTDTLAMALIALGIGASPYGSITSAMAVLLAYYVMVILTMVTSKTTGVFTISFAGIGPTEIRLLIIICTIVAYATPTPAFEFQNARYTLYDGMMLGFTALLVITCAAQAVATARELAKQDPPRG